MARWFRSKFVFPVSRPFVCGCHNISTMLRFHLPLIKLDVQITRIQLSDKDSCFRPRNVTIAQSKLDKSQRLMQVFVGEACIAPTPQFVLPA